MTVGTTGALTYQKVEWFIHRDRQIETDFFTITTASNHSITLSPEHLLPIGECQTVSGQPVMDFITVISSLSQFAKRAQVGKCLFVTGVNGAVEKSQITEVRQERLQGIFAPVTKSGDILVNDVFASCYSGGLESHMVQRSIYHLIFRMSEVLQPIFSLYQQVCSYLFQTSYDTLEIPVVLQILDVAGKLLA